MAAAFVGLTALLPAACTRRTPPGAPPPPPAGDAAAPPAPAGSDPGAAPQPAGQVPVTLFFLRAPSGTGKPELVPVSRRVSLPADAGPADRLKAAFAALAQGPSDAEKAEGLSSAFPAGARLLGLTVRRPFAELNFSRELEQMGGSARVGDALRQIAYTAAAVEPVMGVILKVEGTRVGGRDRPFTGEGFLFRALYPEPDSAFAAGLSPARSLDLFVATVGDRQAMWQMMSPARQAAYGTPAKVEVSAFAEGLGSWRDYTVVEERVEGDRASVTIRGDQVLEGMLEKGATYRAEMVRVDGRWRWDGGGRP